MKEILQSIDKDIESHTKKASEFLSTVHAVLSTAAIFAVLYLLPGIAERALPGFEADLNTAQDSYKSEILAFEKLYNKKFYFVSEKDFGRAKEGHQVNAELTDARKASISAPDDSFVKTLRFFKALKVEDSKMESLAKLIPIILGAVLAGFLLTYRFHVQTAKDFTLKKIELMSKLASGEANNIK